jgi:proteasome alpha subunit
VDEHVGAAIAGLSSDARILIDQARVHAQSNKLTYDEPIDVEVLAKRIGDMMQLYTQHAGVRPFGVSIIFAGVDKTGCRIFQTDPGGNYFGFRAAAIGAGGETLKDFLEAGYSADFKLDDAIILAIQCLAKVMEGKIDPAKIRVAIIPTETKKFRKLTDEELEKYIKRSDIKKLAGK